MTDAAAPATLRIVVGVDGSPPSKVALRWAACLARSWPGAEIEAVSAWHVPSSYGWTTLAPDNWNPREEAERYLRAAVAEALGDDQPPKLVLTVEEGLPTRVLLRHSQHASMLVVGSRGRGGFAALLLGSVGRGCVEHATCPVLVVHGDTVPAPIDPVPFAPAGSSRA